MNEGMTKMNNHIKIKADLDRGIFWSLFATIMFGTADTLLQFLSQHENVSAVWFLSTRTFFAGIILLIIGAFMYRRHFFDIFKSIQSIVYLVLYALLGICVNFLASYLSVQYGNSASMSILQYLSPLFVLLIMVIVQRRAPSLIDVIVFIMAMIGIFLVLTKGNFSKLSISTTALMWGIGAGFGQALYLICPVPLTKKHYPQILILGWGLIISSVAFNLKQPIWVNPPKINLALVLTISCVVLFGTIISFMCFLKAAKYVTSQIMSLTAAFEPITVFILSFIFFNLQVNFIEVLGAVIVLAAIITLQIYHSRANN